MGSDRRGDGATEKELVAFCATEHPRLVGALALYTGDARLGEDLAQEALARICRDWRRVRNAHNPGAYAHRVAINVANSHFRRLRVRRDRHSRAQAQADTVHGDPDHADAVAVRQEIARLPRKKRTALVLRYYRDLSVADTAAAMGVPEGTVKTLTRRALADLEAELGDAAVGEGGATAAAEAHGGEPR